jgi:hypothetical protein
LGEIIQDFVQRLLTLSVRGKLALKLCAAVLTARQQTHGSGLKGKARPWCFRLGTYFELFICCVV